LEVEELERENWFIRTKSSQGRVKNKFFSVDFFLRKWVAMSCEQESILSLDRWLTIARNPSTFKGERETARNLSTVWVSVAECSISRLAWCLLDWVYVFSFRCSAHNLFTHGELLVVANETIAIWMCYTNGHHKWSTLTFFRKPLLNKSKLNACNFSKLTD